MKSIINIGQDKSNDIVIKCDTCPSFLAEIHYDKGFWKFFVIDPVYTILINDNQIKNGQVHILEKYDKITIEQKVIHWQDYLYEGDDQELSLSDFITWRGRVSKANFRALGILNVGLIICILILPAFVAKAITFSSRRVLRDNHFDELSLTQTLSNIIYPIGYGLLGLFFLILSIKRLRDTKKSIWWILVPIYNLRILFFSDSK